MAGIDEEDWNYYSDEEYDTKKKVSKPSIEIVHSNNVSKYNDKEENKFNSKASFENTNASPSNYEVNIAKRVVGKKKKKFEDFEKFESKNSKPNIIIDNSYNISYGNGHKKVEDYSNKVEKSSTPVDANNNYNSFKSTPKDSTTGDSANNSNYTSFKSSSTRDSNKFNNNNEYYGSKNNYKDTRKTKNDYNIKKDYSSSIYNKGGDIKNTNDYYETKTGNGKGAVSGSINVSKNENSNSNYSSSNRNSNPIQKSNTAYIPSERTIEIIEPDNYGSKNKNTANNPGNTPKSNTNYNTEIVVEKVILDKNSKAKNNRNNTKGLKNNKNDYNAGTYQNYEDTDNTNNYPKTTKNQTTNNKKSFNDKYYGNNEGDNNYNDYDNYEDYQTYTEPGDKFEYNDYEDYDDNNYDDNNSNYDKYGDRLDNNRNFNKNKNKSYWGAVNETATDKIEKIADKNNYTVGEKYIDNDYADNTKNTYGKNKEKTKNHNKRYDNYNSNEIEVIQGKEKKANDDWGRNKNFAKINSYPNNKLNTTNSTNKYVKEKEVIVVIKDVSANDNVIEVSDKENTTPVVEIEKTMENKVKEAESNFVPTESVNKNIDNNIESNLINPDLDLNPSNCPINQQPISNSNYYFNKNQRPDFVYVNKFDDIFTPIPTNVLISPHNFIPNANNVNNNILLNQTSHTPNRYTQAGNTFFNPTNSSMFSSYNPYGNANNIDNGNIINTIENMQHLSETEKYVKRITNKLNLKSKEFTPKNKKISLEDNNWVNTTTSIQKPFLIIRNLPAGVPISTVYGKMETQVIPPIIKSK